ncbi:MAG: RICIN domain-containing protein [Clostridium sp.]|nr:RICIN domain-containing protein [Clostridium sp.]MCM1547450.1 RICIN domain-containing protein [Ruminococcus sp.]
MKKNIFKKFLSMTTLGVLTSSLIAGSLTVKADIADSGNNIVSECTQISNLKTEALNEYESGSYKNSSIPTDYKVLFVECKSIKTSKKTYSITSVEDTIFNEAVKNFEDSVESFSNYNVNIIADKKYINDTINCTGSYVMYEDIKDYLADLAPYGYYDAVLVCGAVSEFTLGVTSRSQFNGDTGYGYTYVTICTNNDINSINKGTNTSYPYLTTTNVAIHEWLHTLESYRDLGISYPNTHGYLADYTEASAAAYSLSSDNDDDICYYCNYEDIFGHSSEDIDTHSEHNSTPYASNSNYSNNYYRWPVYQTTGIEVRLTNFYKAVLRGEIYDINDSRNVGMFPKLWKLNPRKMFLGTYTLKLNNNNTYFINNNGSLSYTTAYTNDIKFQWNLVHDFKHGNVAIISNSDYRRFDIVNLHVSPTCLNICYSTGYNTAQTFKPVLNSDGTYKFQCIIPNYNSYYIRLYGSSMGVSNVNSYNNWVLTKVNAYEGEYYIKNVSENKYLTVNDKSMSLSGFTAADNQKWKLRYYKDGFYKISPSSNLSLYFDVNNNTEGRSVALGNWTGYPTAQTWQLKYNSDGSFYIVPLVSVTRGLTYNNSFSITTLNGSNTQKWAIEKVNSGKELFEGKYKIKNSNNQYLGYSGNTLTLGKTASTWNFTSYGDNYYFISPVGTSSVLYWDVANNYDLENNTVQLCPRTGYDTAQTWKAVMQNDGSVVLIPMISLTRGLTFINSKSVLSTSYNYWYLEKV